MEGRQGNGSLSKKSLLSEARCSNELHANENQSQRHLEPKTILGWG